MFPLANEETNKKSTLMPLTPLDLAIDKGNDAIIDLLLKKRGITKKS